MSLVRPKRHQNLFSASLALTLVFALHGSIWGQVEGQADLDEATQMKLNAESMADLERVIELCDSAIAKGLDEDSAMLAKSLATATLYQHGSRFAQALFSDGERAQRPAMLKRFALQDFNKALEYDDNLPRVHMMIARLEATNTGTKPNQENFRRGFKSASRAVELLEDAEDPPLLSKALVLRASYQRGPAQMEDLDRAIESDATNVDAWRTRGLNLLLQGEFLAANGQLDRAKDQRKKALDDFTQLIEQNPNDHSAHQALAELLEKLGDLDEAKAHADTAIKLNPNSPGLYRMRAKVARSKSDYDAALKDLNRAIDIQPDDFRTFLERSNIYFDKGDKEAAATDFNKARELEPSATNAVLQGVAVRSQGSLEKGIAEMQRYVEIEDLAAKQNGTTPNMNYRRQLAIYQSQNQDFDDAVATLKKCGELDEEPIHKDILTQLGNVYLLAHKPLEAIEIFSVVLEREETEFAALRGRADAYLSTGEQAKSLVDYEKAREVDPKDDGVLNNLAWVLATSPKDELRDGKRAIELATLACEATEYQQAHILSTLAAAHAEAGDFDKAVEWSTKAIEMDRSDTVQLRDELESYTAKKPWRELQDVTAEAETSEQPAVDSDDSDDSADESAVEDAEEDADADEESAEQTEELEAVGD